MTMNSNIGRSNIRRRKAELRLLLQQRDLDGVRTWSRDNANALSTLSSMLFEADELIRWRAIEAIGETAKAKFDDEPDKVRAFVRRLFWLMNDESGGICWHAPEAIAEVIHRVPELLLEYSVILTSYLEEEPFEAGVCWAISRLAELAGTNDDLAAVMNRKRTVLLDYLQHEDARRRAFALSALTALPKPLKDDVKARLLEDTARVTLYDFRTGELQQTTIADLARSGTSFGS